MDIKSLLTTALDVGEQSEKSRADVLHEALAAEGDDLDVGQLQQDVVAEFDERHADGKFNPDDEATLYALADVADALKAENTRRSEADAEQAAKFDELAARIGPDPSTEPAGDDTNGEDGGAESDDPGDSADNGTNGEQADTGTNDEQEVRQPVAASRRSRPAMSARDLNAHRPKQTAPGSTPTRRMVLTAAADVPQVPSGSTMDMDSLSEATIRRFQSMPLGSPNASVRNGLAIIKRDSDEAVTASGDRRDVEKIDTIADETRLPGGSLLAAQQQTITAAAQQGTFSYGGVWCAPSETSYELCPSLATTSGIADFPSITVNHGGIRYPVYRDFPDWDVEFQDFDENADFTTTPKTCVMGPCPEWEEARLRVAPLCVQGDILRERGYPELTRRFIDDVLLKHQHFMNSLRLNWIDQASTALPAFDASTGMGAASYSIADRIGLLVEWMRERYRMADGATLEGIAPTWLKGLLKSDIAKRNNRASTSVTDAEANQVFTERGARIQWVYDWQPMAQPSETTPPAAFPDAANILLYPAGAWVAGDQDIITLDAVYDSQNLRNNVYTALFTESSWLMLNRCNPSYKVQLTGLCANGAVGGFRDVCPPATADAGTTV